MNEKIKYIVKLINDFTSSILIYEIFLVALFFLKSNPFCDSLIVTEIMMLVSVVWGIIISIKVFFQNKNTLLTSILFYLLILFIISYCISIVLNIEYGFLNNVKDITWFTVQIFAIFFNNVYQSKEANDRCLKKIAWFYVLISFVMATGSIVFVFIAKGGTNAYGKWGFLAQRLFGLYRSPNYGAIYCVISIVLSIMLFQTVCKKSTKCFLVSNIATNGLYVIYSGSKTGMLVLAAAETMMFLWFLFVVIKNSESLKQRNCGIALIVTLCFVSIITIICTKPVTSYIISQYQSENSVNQINTKDNKWNAESSSEKITSQSETSQTKANQNEKTNSQNKEQDDEQTQENVSFKRTDFIKEDMVGNGRLIHWKLGIGVFKTRPLFGTTTRGVGLLAKNMYPNAKAHEIPNSLENDLITLIVCTGIVGTVIFLIFTITCIIKVIYIVQYYIKNKYYLRLGKIWFALTVLVAVVISAISSDAIIFTNVLQSTIFWIFLGYILSFNNFVKKEDVSNEKNN